MTTPTPGAIVLFNQFDGTNFKGPQAAIVTDVHSNDDISVTVFPPGKSPFSAKVLLKHEEAAPAPTGQSFCTWPATPKT